MSRDKVVAAGARVLIVDDDAELCELVAEYLTARGFTVETESDGGRGLERARQGHYDLMVLDVMLPTLDGFEVLRHLRAGGGEAALLPVVMLTAHGDEVDRIVGLELGADDYLPKPFNVRELLARMSAILRRIRKDEGGRSFIPHPSSLLKVGDVEMEVGARRVRRAGEILDLTATEFDLLHVLLRGAGRVVTREELAREALGRRLLPYDRSLDMHISKLRRKLAPGVDGAERITTVRGVGYIFVKDENER
jgi:DNA-binding response OmpR family regulator